MGRRESPVRARGSPRRERRESPVRARGSPRRERERSPARDRNSNAEQLSTRKKSSRHSRSKSPAFHSPKRERSSTHTKSPKRRKSPSPVSHSPGRHRPSGRTLSPKRAVSESPSPRTKRLKRAKAERDAGRDREHEENSGRKGDSATYKEEDLDREFPVAKRDKEMPVEKRDRRAGRDEIDNSSSRHRRGASPSNNRNRADSRGRDELRSSRDDEQQNGDNDSVAKMKAAEETLEEKEKQKPSFELSGKLAAETNRFRGVTLLFNEPPDARISDVRWRLYVFKGGEVLNEPLYVHRQSCYLFGRERRVADIPTDHPSCSKQHAVLQYRQVEQENPDGSMSKRVRPYLMDLGSTNGTFINEDRIEAQRYYELFEKDNIKFGNSSREYVLLHENSAA